MKNIHLFILLSIAGWAVACSQPSLVVEITELDLSAFAVGWGEVKANQSITSTPLSIAGTQYEKGLGTHATGEAHIRLDGRQGTFTALVGVDDNADLQGSVGYDGKFLARDLWRQTDLGALRKVTSFDIPRHGCVMLKIVKQ
ncbi:hypothetical protein FACS189430_02450 [Bacteroidia bacterium]|nr:hypothetical protein FACS189430_02450 [Bacteroidia bacterium]